jgi:hypothetical protein
VRDGIVDMQKFEILAYRNLRHLGCQRQAVGRVFEQGIVENLHFVVIDILDELVETVREGCRDEVNGVPPPRKTPSQLGRHRTGTAVCGITVMPMFIAPQTPMWEKT